MAINSIQKRAVGIAGLRGRHILYHEEMYRMSARQLTCEGIAEAIGMVKVDEQWKHNKKAIMPQIDYGKCVFCGLCVDACPFYALFMTNDYATLIIYEGTFDLYSSTISHQAEI